MTELYFSAEEFRQFVYCPRIIFFRHVSKIIPKQTYKMKYGSDYHDNKIRRKAQSIKENLVITYNLFLEDHSLGIYALLDAVAIERGEEYYPIEFKTGKIHSLIPEHHFAQLLAQAVLLENCFRTIVSKVEIRYGADKRFIVPISENDKRELFNLLQQMRKMIMDETIPKPTPATNKCQDCEFWLNCKRA